MYSEVRTFLHTESAATAMFKSITNSGNNTVRLSENHVIFARNTITEEFQSMYVYSNCWLFTYSKTVLKMLYWPISNIYMHIQFQICKSGNGRLWSTDCWKQSIYAFNGHRCLQPHNGRYRNMSTMHKYIREHESSHLTVYWVLTFFGFQDFMHL